MILYDEYYDEGQLMDEFSEHEHALSMNYEHERLGLWVDYETKLSAQKELAYKMFKNRKTKLAYDPELTDRSGW